jgi:hypothetical protein
LKLLSSLLFLSLIFTSCSAKKKSIPTSLRLFSSAITSSININGGVYISGKSSSGDTFAFGIQVPSQEVVVDLTPGDWTFSAISWSGELGPMTGTNKCALTTTPIDGKEMTVELEMKENNCINPELYNLTHMTGNQFNDLRLVACRNLVQVDQDLLNTETCSDIVAEQGANLSYRVLLKGIDIQKGLDLPNLVSACITNGTLSSSDYTTNIKIPLDTDGTFPFVILAYEDLNCNSDALEVTYLHEFDKAPPGKFKSDNVTLVGPSANQSTLYIADNYIGFGTSTFGHPEVPGNIIPKMPNTSNSGTLAVPPSNNHTGSPYENIRDAYFDIAGTSTLQEVWGLGKTGEVLAAAGGPVYKLTTTVPTDQYNGFKIYHNYVPVPTECSITTSYNSGTTSLTINFCQQVPTTTPTTSAHIVSAINNELTVQGLSSYLIVSDENSASVFTHNSIVSYIEMQNGEAQESPERRNSGKLGEIASSLTGEIGALIYLAGYPTCASIPNTGSFSFNLEEGDYITIIFAEPQVPMTNYMTNYGLPNNHNTFEKRILVSDNGNIREIFEINCAGSGEEFAGYYKAKDNHDGNHHEVELFYNTSDPHQTTLDITKFYEHTYNGKLHKNKEWTLLVNDNSANSRYSVWHQRIDHNVTDGIYNADRYHGRIETNTYTLVSSKNFPSEASMNSSTADWTTGMTQNKYDQSGVFDSNTATDLDPIYNPSLLSSMLNTDFKRMNAAIPNDMAPMAPKDNRLLEVVSPFVSYSIYRDTMVSLEKWSKLNGTGCATTQAELEKHILPASSELILPRTEVLIGTPTTSTYSFLDDGDFFSYYQSGPYSLDSTFSCSSVKFKSNLLDLDIDKSTVERVDGTTLDYAVYEDGVIFELTSPVDHNSAGNTPLSMIMILTADSLVPMKWYGDQTPP